MGLNLELTCPIWTCPRKDAIRTAIRSKIAHAGEVPTMPWQPI
jgi:hypothetical protein